MSDLSERVRPSFGVVFEGCSDDELRENAPVEPERVALLGGDALLGLSRNTIEFVLIRAAEFFGRNRGPADFRNGAASTRAGEHVGNTPDAEANDQNSKSNLGDRSLGAPSSA